MDVHRGTVLLCTVHRGTVLLCTVELKETVLLCSEVALGNGFSVPSTTCRGMAILLSQAALAAGQAIRV